MCSAKKPKVEKSAPPPMYIPEQQSEEVQRKRTTARARAATQFGRESTVLGGPVVAPTGQTKSLLGS